MIYDFLQNANLYRPLSTRLAQGFDWLNHFDIKTQDGRIDIAGDDVFAIVQSYNTYPAQERRFESHLKYIDIQYVYEGEEIMYYARTKDLAVLEAYNLEKEVAFYKDPQEAVTIPVRAGQFTVFYPDDAHKPCCILKASSFVRKVVVKVKV